jgi:hypothetical protein
MAFKIGNFKGNIVITLQRDENDKYPATFGVAKAKLILAHIKEIEEFVKENDKPFKKTY